MITKRYRGYRLELASTGEALIYYGSDLVEVAQTPGEAEAHIDGWHEAA